MGGGKVVLDDGDTTFIPNHQQMLKRWSKAFRPKPRYSTAEWVQTHVRIPPEIGASPGAYSIESREYLLGPLAAVDDPEVEEIVLMLPTQVGKTTFLQALLQSRSDTCPSPCMLAGPDQDEILKLRDDFYRMAACSKRLRDVIPPERLRNDRWIEFAGIRCYLAWAGNTQRLAGKSVQMVLSTEIDKWSQSPREGNTQALVRNRVKAWFRSLILWESTPTHEASPIAELYERSNKCRFYVPCPHCHHFQVLRFHVLTEGPYAGRGGVVGIQRPDGSFVTPDEAIKSAYYLCEQGCRIENTSKRWMVARGVWVPEGMTVTAKELKGGDVQGVLSGTPDKSQRISGYQMTSLVSATISFGKMAAAYLDAKDDDKLLQDFVNNWLGERWTKRAKVLKWDKLYTRLRAGHSLGHVPATVFFITVGCDVQGDRCYYVIRGWGEGSTSWLIDRGCCQQTIGTDGLGVYNSDLDQLDDLVVNRNFPLDSANPAGWLTLQARLIGLDCNFQGHRVWNWIRKRNQDRIRAVAGDSQMSEPFFRMTVVEKSARDGKIYEGGLRRWGINTMTYKTDIQTRWDQPLHEPGAWFLCNAPRESLETYLRQVTNEGLVWGTNKQGRPVREWMVLEPKVGNHYWDCEIYAAALADMVTGGDWHDLLARSAPPVSNRSSSVRTENEGFSSRD